MQLTFKYRIKDKHAKRLGAQARAVNFVWNYCNETQQKAARARRKWLTGYDLVGLTAGQQRPGKISRNTWITEAVQEKLARESAANGNRRARGES